MIHWKNIDIQKDIEAFENFIYFKQNILRGQTVCGLTHKISFFCKRIKRYENYIKVLIDKLTHSIVINDKYNEKKVSLCILRLDNVNPKICENFATSGHETEILECFGHLFQ